MAMRFARAITGTSFGLTCLLVLGCGGHPASVTGTITLDGRALPAGANGGVTFHPVAGGTPANALLLPDGTYNLNTGSQHGLEPGRYRVTITVLETLPPRLKDGTQEPGKLLSAQRYRDKERSGLEVEVKPGKNRVDFDVDMKRDN